MLRSVRNNLSAILLAALLPAQVVAQPIEVPLAPEPIAADVVGPIKELISRYEHASRVWIVVSVPVSHEHLFDVLPSHEQLRGVTHEASDGVMRMSLQPRNAALDQTCPWLIEIQDPSAPLDAGAYLPVTGGDRVAISRKAQFRVISTAPLSAQLYAFAETDAEGVRDLIADPREDIPVTQTAVSERVLLASSSEASEALEELRAVLARSKGAPVQMPGFFEEWDDALGPARGISPDVQRISSEMIADVSSSTAEPMHFGFEEHLLRCSLTLDIGR